MTRILIAFAFLQLTAPVRAQQQATLASLISEAQAIVIAEISDTDYSQTRSDGPMTAHATVLNSLKGRLKKDQSFRFSETAWVGPRYKASEVRILFLEPAAPNSWQILANLYAKTDFFVERDAAPILNVNSLKNVLDKLSAPASRSVLITKDMLN